jgi:hypothetical protein
MASFLNCLISGECVLSVTNKTTFYLRLSPSFHGSEPMVVNEFMVPVFLRTPPPTSGAELAKMDVLSQKVSFFLLRDFYQFSRFVLTSMAFLVFVTSQLTCI